jgi:hypothetical protein
MLLALLLITALASSPPAPAPTAGKTTSECNAQSGWDRGRVGGEREAACSRDAYAEAYRLGEALHQLQQERIALDSELRGIAASQRGARLRRQRQIDTDLEAIRGVAIIRGWERGAAVEPAQ